MIAAALVVALPARAAPGPICGNGTVDSWQAATPGPCAPCMPGHPCPCATHWLTLSEPCDGADVGGKTCADLGFAAGELACEADCTGHDVRGCRICAPDDRCAHPELAGTVADAAIAARGDEVLVAAWSAGRLVLLRLGADLVVRSRAAIDLASPPEDVALAVAGSAGGWLVAARGPAGTTLLTADAGSLATRAVRTLPEATDRPMLAPAGEGRTFVSSLPAPTRTWLIVDDGGADASLAEGVVTYLDDPSANAQVLVANIEGRPLVLIVAPGHDGQMIGYGGGGWNTPGVRDVVTGWGAAKHHVVLDANGGRVDDRTFARPAAPTGLPFGSSVKIRASATAAGATLAVALVDGALWIGRTP